MESFEGVSPHHPITNESEIRVIILHPGKFGDPVRCELEHVQLVPGEDFEAVSYTWGTSPIRIPITLNGQVYPVTTNLFTGLQYLRQSDSPRRLWIDSLCINQSDKAERSQEVQKMRDIYRFASDVIVWIGDYAPFTRADVKALFKYIITLWSSKGPEGLDKTIRLYGYDHLWKNQARLCDFIKSRGWFERMWIIQEVSVRPDIEYDDPENAPKFHCGSLQISSAYLREAVLWWLFFKKRDTQLPLPVVPVSVLRLYTIWFVHHDIATTEQEKKDPLGAVLSWILGTVAGKFFATDPRDIMYALLGLLPTPLPSTLVPDYYKSPAQVLTEYATYILDTEGLIDIIQYTSGLTKGLPSWVPDWKCASPHGMKRTERRQSATHIRIVGNGKGLEVELLKFTEVKQCGPVLWSKRETPIDSNVSVKLHFQQSKSIPIPQQIRHGTKNHQSSRGSMRETSIELFASLDLHFQLIQDMLMPKQNDPKTTLEFRKRLYELLIRFDIHVRQLRDMNWHWNASRKGLYFLPWYDERPFWNYEYFSGRSESATYLEAFYTEEVWRSAMETFENKYMFSCLDGSMGIVAQSFVPPMEGDIICSFKGSCGEFIVRPCCDGYRLIARCERTVKGFSCDIENTDLRTWSFGSHTLRIFKPLWKTKPIERIVLW